MGDTPIPLASVRPLPCLGFADSAFHKIGKASTDLFPALPYVHTDSAVAPFACAYYEVLHIRIAIVRDPSSNILGESGLEPFVSLTATATRYLLQGA